MSARDDVVKGLEEHACCFSDEDAKRMTDAHRDEVALGIGRDALRDGLVPTLTRLVGEANAAKLLADYRDAVAHELAEQQRHHVRHQGQNPLHYGSAHWAMIGVDEAADLIDPQKSKP